MNTIASLAAFLLAAVFGIAGVTKAMNGTGTVATLRTSGFPAPVAAAMGMMLPPTEIAIAALLLTPAALGAAIAGFLLLGAFSLLILVNLARDRHPECNCFGQLAPAPMNGSSLLRNLVLGAVAAALIWWHAPAAERVTDPPLFGAAEWLGMSGITALAIVVLGTLIVSLHHQLDALTADWRQFATRHQVLTTTNVAAEGLEIGTPAPRFSLRATDGETVSLSDLRRPAGVPLVLVFTDSSCRSCDELMPAVARWQREHGSDLVIAVVGRGSIAETAAKAAEYGIARLLIQVDREVAAAYMIRSAPAAIAIGSEGTIRSRVAVGEPTITRLIEGVIRQRAREVTSV